MLKIMVVIGTRPEAIKMAPVVKELEKYPDIFQPLVVVTGQHREMLDQALNIFSIVPHYDLKVMQPNQTLSSLTALLITRLDEIMVEERPDWVLAQGDTTSVMVAGLVAFYRGIRVGHIEAGLRTHDLKQPFPEELNRRYIDVVSDLYFAPTEHTRNNLLREGVNPDSVLMTGNTVIDALLMMAEQVRHAPIAAFVPDMGDKRLILVTSHRRESFGEPFAQICRAIKSIAERYRDTVHIVYPVHYNPNVRVPAHEILGNISNITLIDPVSYETMVQLMDRAYLILTDSGGIQEEAPSLHKPVLILREVTERQEVVEAGAARLVGCDYDAIVRETTRLLEDSAHYRAMAQVTNPYGDGQASHRIITAIMRYHKLAQVVM